MLDLTDIGLRLIQYLAAMIVGGMPPLFLYTQIEVGGPAGARLRNLISVAAWSLLFATVLSIFVKTAIMAGSIGEGLKPEALRTVLLEMPLGRALVIRAALLSIFLAMLSWLPRRGLAIALMAVGAAIVTTFAWVGHGASGGGFEKILHLTSDITHLICAAVWLGALAGFCALVLPQNLRDAEVLDLANVLKRFSGVGGLAVAFLVGSGLINSWFLVGPDRVGLLLTKPYGLLLCAKIAILLGMVAFAAANRFLFTPRLLNALGKDSETRAALGLLKRSLVQETALGVIVLGLVSLLGTMAPISMQ